MLSLSDFDFLLPPERIAAFPPQDRASAKLLKVDRRSGEFSHHIFRDISQFLKEGDLLVLNNTKVLPARIFGKKITGGKVEALLLKQKGTQQWEALLRPGGRIKKGAQLEFGENGTRLHATVLDDARRDSAERLLQFEGNAAEIIPKIGHIPLPPYLGRPDSEIDREMYQTVFAEKEGAVASPTAGLHFTNELLSELEKKGVEITYVTLHTGYGTFQTISSEDLSLHRMFTEDYEITEKAAASINTALKQKRRVIACGTTSVRTVESAVDESGFVKAQSGQTRLFIYPPYSFKVVSALITNFHLPKSSLLLLAAAFLGENGRDKLFKLYEEAMRSDYRFYSYGDAMVIL